MKNATINVRYLVSGVLLMICIFLLEINTGILAGTVSYILIALYVLWFSKDVKYLVWFGLLSSTLIIAGYFFTSENVMSGQSILLNRSLTLIAIWLAVYTAFRYKAASRERAFLMREKLEAANRHNNEFERQVTFRTQELQEANRQLLNEIEERKRIEQKLRQSQQLYHVMAHNFPEGIIGVLDKDLRYLFVDGEELKQIGLSEEHIGDRFVYETLDGYDSRELITELAAVYEGKKVKQEFELNNITYSLTAVPIYDDQVEVKEALIVIRNITQRKNVEKELRNMLDRERDLNMLKSRFVTTASHEFRTPLTTILSSVFLLQSYNDEEHAGKRRNHLDRIARAVHGLTELLNEFLSLGRLEEGKIEVSYSETDIDHLLQEVLEEMELVKKETQTIDLRVFQERASIITDPKILKTVLRNLLSNAIKYSPTPSDIHVTVEVVGRTMELKVRDQGIGIPEAEQQHIFERFFRASNSGNIQGTGLGLNIVKKYVDLLNAEIWFESRESKGTVFTVSIPI